MKIPFTNIHVGRIENKALPKPDVLTKIVQTQLTRSRAQVKQWIDATATAESIMSPSRTELIRIYNNIVIDGHLAALANVLKLRISGSPVQFVNAAGEKDDAASAIISTTWFRKILEMYADAEFYGYSLAQITEINGDRVQIDEIPRQYVAPEKPKIKLSQSEAYTAPGISITNSTYTPALIWRNSGHLGLFHAAAPLVLTKRAVAGAWSEYCEIFGMPIRIGKTNINVPANANNMRSMLENMGSAAWAMLDESDKIEFVETSRTDAYQVFDQFINRQNSELSKLILGQTGTTDEKAFTGSANVHADVLDAIVISHVEKLINWINSDVLPKLAAYSLVPAGVTLAPVGDIRLTVEQKVDAIAKLSNSYTIDPEWITSELGIPVQPKQAPAAPGEIINRRDIDIRGILNKIYFGD